MEHLSNLFFELSHVDRLGILNILKEEPMKLTNISEKMDCSTQEAYRHLSRLLDSGLASKTPGGDYIITSFGRQLMRLVPGFSFLNDNRKYFNSRDLSVIPEEFLLRIGELNSSILVDDVMVTLFDVEVMVKEAEEYIYIIIDQMIMNLYEPLIDATDRGTVFKEIRPRGWKLPDDIAARIDEKILKKAFEKVRKGEVIQRELEKVPVVLAFSEKSVACLSFLDVDGEMDYLGFKSDDIKAHKWCRELFEYYWERAEKAKIRTKIL